MAAPYAHCLVSREALRKLYKNRSLARYRSITNPDENAPYFPYVCVGSVSPDFPYPALHMGVNSKTDGNGWTWGDKFHKENTGNFVDIGVQELRQMADKNSEVFYKKAAWLMGYYSHVITDLVVHAVVYRLVGGCYENHSQEHLHCEVVQDSLLFHELYSDPPQELVDTGFLLMVLEKCQVVPPPTGNETPTYLPRYVFDPDIEGFWKSILSRNYADFYEAEPPEIDDWHRLYTFIMVNGKRIAARKFEPDMAYKKTTDISPDEKTKYYTDITLPDGTTGASYTEKVFNKAVVEVTKRLKAFLKALDTDAHDSFKKTLGVWNLDKGIVADRNPKFALWNGEITDLFKCPGDPPSA